MAVKDFMAKRVVYKQLLQQLQTLCVKKVCAAYQ